MEVNPIAVLRAPKEKKKKRKEKRNLPQKASIMLPVVFSSFPSPEPSFPLLLSDENVTFVITTVSSAHLGRARDALLNPPQLLNPELVPLCHSFQSGCFLVTHTLQGCFTQICRQDFLCMFLLLPPCHPPTHPRHPLRARAHTHTHTLEK